MSFQSSSAGAAEGPVELVVSLSYPPFLTNDIDGQGLFTEIVDASFKAADTGWKIKELPSKRVYREVLNGNFVGSYGWSYTPQREEDFLLSAPFYAYENVVFTSFSEFSFLDQPDKLQHQSIQPTLCVPLGWKVVEGFRPYIEEGSIALLAPEKLESCFELLRSGRVHLLTFPELTIKYVQDRIIRQTPDFAEGWPYLSKVKGPRENLGTVHLILSKGAEAEAVKEKFDCGLQKIVQSGEYQRILEKYVAAYPMKVRHPIYSYLKQVGILPY